MDQQELDELELDLAPPPLVRQQRFIDRFMIEQEFDFIEEQLLQLLQQLRLERARQRLFYRQTRQGG